MTWISAHKWTEVLDLLLRRQKFINMSVNIGFVLVECVLFMSLLLKWQNQLECEKNMDSLVLFQALDFHKEYNLWLHKFQNSRNLLFLIFSHTLKFYPNSYLSVVILTPEITTSQLTLVFFIFGDHYSQRSKIFILP